MKYDAWAAQKRIERMYERLLRTVFQEAAKAEKHGSLMDFLNSLANSQRLKDLAEQAALKMVLLIDAANERTWREAAQKALRGRFVYRALHRELGGRVGGRVREIVDANAKLIRSIPRTLASRVSHQIAQAQQRGTRAKTMEAQIRKQIPGMTAARIRLIARTETSKASTALTQARAERLRLSWYVWRSSHDQRVRPSHSFMAKSGGVLVPWGSPPQPEELVGEKSTLGAYHAGSAPNCRCYAEPLMRFEQIEFPHRVYYNGRVQSMTLARFREIASVGIRVA